MCSPKECVVMLAHGFQHLECTPGQLPCEIAKSPQPTHLLARAPLTHLRTRLRSPRTCTTRSATACGRSNPVQRVSAPRGVRPAQGVGVVAGRRGGGLAGRLGEGGERLDQGRALCGVHAADDRRDLLSAAGRDLVDDAVTREAVRK